MSPRLTEHSMPPKRVSVLQLMYICVTYSHQSQCVNSGWNMTLFLYPHESDRVGGQHYPTCNLDTAMLIVKIKGLFGVYLGLILKNFNNTGGRMHQIPQELIWSGTLRHEPITPQKASYSPCVLESQKTMPNLLLGPTKTVTKYCTSFRAHQDSSQGLES